jgi:hypothetical protein
MHSLTNNCLTKENPVHQGPLAVQPQIQGVDIIRCTHQLASNIIQQNQTNVVKYDEEEDDLDDVQVGCLIDLVNLELCSLEAMLLKPCDSKKLADINKQLDWIQQKHAILKTYIKPIKN